MRRFVCCALCALCCSTLLAVTAQADFSAYRTVKITDNATEDMYPAISGSNVAWQGNDGDWEIYFWDGASTTQLTSNDTRDEDAAISGSNVVWVGCVGGTGSDCSGGFTQIFLWNGTSTTPITSNNGDKATRSMGSVARGPDISGSNVVFADNEDHWEIYLWDGASITRVTDNADSVVDLSPAVSGSNVVWQQCDGDPDYFDCRNGDWEIYLWNGSFPIASNTTRITDNGTHDRLPRISGSNVVWECDDGNDSEICFWDGSTTQLTSNSVGDYAPDISGSNVVWHGWDPYYRQIFLWDGTTITQITDDAAHDSSPAISGSNLAWQGEDGPSGDYEIYRGIPLGPIPALPVAGLLVTAGLLGLVGWLRLRE